MAVTAFGSILPDLIDKPLGHLLFYEFFHNNRIFAHTLLFVAILFILSVYLYQKGHKWMPFLALGSFIHLILDEMWKSPKTLFWPLYGFDFETVNLENWVANNIYALFHNPKIYIPELIGLIIIVLIIFRDFIPMVFYTSGLPQIPDSVEKNEHKVSLVIPTMNESKNIPHVFPQIPEIVDEIVVIDSSKDNTVETIKKIRPDAKVYIEEPNGKGLALRKGSEYATGDIVIMIDADGSMDLQEIPLFVKPLVEGYDAVFGSRRLGGSEDLTLLRLIGNSCFGILVNILFDTDYTDINYGYRGFRKHALEKLNWQSNGFDVEAEQTILVKKMGLNVCEVPCYEKKRIFGDGKLKTFGDGRTILMRILKEKIA